MKIDLEMFPDAEVVKDEMGRPRLKLDIQTGVETSMRSISHFGILLMAVSFILFLLGVSYAALVFVFSTLFYLLAYAVANRTQIYYLIDPEREVLLYHIGLIFFEFDHEYLHFDEISDIGVRSKFYLRYAPRNTSSVLTHRSDYNVVYDGYHQLVALARSGKLVALGHWKEGMTSQTNQLARAVAKMMNVEVCPADRNKVVVKRKIDNEYRLIYRPFSKLLDTAQGKVLIVLGIAALCGFLMQVIADLVFGITLFQ